MREGQGEGESRVARQEQGQEGQEMTMDACTCTCNMYVHVARPRSAVWRVLCGFNSYIRLYYGKGSAHDTRKGRRRTKFRLPCAYLWLSPPSARSARRLRLPTIRFEQNPPAGWPSSSAAVLRSGRSVRRRRRTAGWQAKQHAIEEHGYESCLRRQLAHHHRRGRAADACCSGRRQNRAGSSR